jgi:hypothetical protein
MTLSSKLNNAQFAEVFLKNYLVGGFGSLSKRETDLLVLRSYLEATMDAPITAVITKADPYQLGRDLNIRASRIRTMLDDLRYRYPPSEDELRSQLTDALNNAEIILDKNTLRIQIDDLLLRDYVRKIVRDRFGLVDTSFDRTIISLTPEKFLALAIASQDEASQAELERRLRAIKLKSELGAPKEGRVRWLIKKVGEGAANEVGKKILEEAPSWITTKGEVFIDFVVKLPQILSG